MHFFTHSHNPGRTNLYHTLEYLMCTHRQYLYHVLKYLLCTHPNYKLEYLVDAYSYLYHLLKYFEYEFSI